MKLTIILSTKNEETNWNALRLANLALNKGCSVTIFLTGEGVEYQKPNSTQYNITKEIQEFLRFERAKIIACGTCMNIRDQKGSKECPAGGIEDLYKLIEENDKIITF